MEQPILYMLPDANEPGGFGFLQGSTDGVINRYQYRGFHRPGAREANKKSRDSLNLRHCKGAYKCHFDPEYDVRTHRNHHHKPKKIHFMKKIKQNKKTFLFVGIVTACLLVFIATRRAA